MIMQCHQLYTSPETPSQSCSSSKGTGEHISVVQSMHLLPCGNFYTMAKTLEGWWDQGNYMMTLLLRLGTHFCRTEESCSLPEHRLAVLDGGRESKGESSVKAGWQRWGCAFRKLSVKCTLSTCIEKSLGASYGLVRRAAPRTWISAAQFWFLVACMPLL